MTPSPDLDARLLGPAAAAWVASALALTCVPPPGRPGLAIPATAALVGCAVAGALLVRSRSPWTQALVAICAAASAAVLSSALHSSALTSPPLPDWAAAHRTVTVEGVVTTEVRVRTRTGAAVWQGTTVRQAGLASTRISSAVGTIDVQVPIVMRLGERMAAPPPGSLVTVRGRLLPSSTAAGTLIADGILVRAGPGIIDAAAHAVREGLHRATSMVPRAPGALVAGLATGDDSDLPTDVADDMQAAGLTHLTAVSGGNVAIVLGLVLGAAEILRLSLLWRVAMGLAALGGFVVLVGPQPSVLRSAAMGAVIVVSLLSGGRRRGPSVLASAVLVLVIASPDLAVSWGFALSALATAGLILLAPRIEAGLAAWSPCRRWPERIRQGVALTAAAQAATLPVLAAMGAFAGWASLPANLLAEPVVAPITVLGLLAAVVSPWWPFAAGLLVQVAAVPAQWLVWIAHASLQLPFASVGWPVGMGGVALCAVVVTAFLLARQVHRRWRPRRRWWLATSVLAIAALVVAGGGRRAWPPPGWFMIMCDVGQGDAVLLRSGQGQAVLVDTGPDPDLVDRCLHDAGIARLPAIVLTHFHADHVNGLPGALRQRSVGTVLVTPIREPLSDFRDVETWTRGLAVSTVTAGDTRVIGEVSWRALWPARRIDAGSVPNNASIVLDVVVAGERVLLTGDVEREAQADLVQHLHPFDVVKVPHHGSSNQSADLPTRAPARIALVSVGVGNPYGHPSPTTIEAWARTGALVLRTDLGGDIAIVRTPTGPVAVTRG